MPDTTFKKLYVDELKDLYSAENQLVKALPKMAKAVSADELRQGFEDHLKQTKGHVARLEKIFRSLGESPKGKKCMGMEGLIKEGAESIDDGFEGAVLDAALIGAAQRVEHYEIAAYGTVYEFAKIEKKRGLHLVFQSHGVPGRRHAAHGEPREGQQRDRRAPGFAFNLHGFVGQRTHEFKIGT